MESGIETEVNKRNSAKKIQNFYGNGKLLISGEYFMVKWWARLDSNQRPIDYESTALTTELQALSEVYQSSEYLLLLELLDYTDY